ncbi:MAG: prolipoprotein diacylglyceryl transferase family protein, partial [Vampirovibrionales bacterium]|nr:prolipoprotein diacylglyceryl transferase family protein [Vampirovibrionales bacterium]
LECKSIVPAGRLTSLSLIGAGLLRFVVEATRGDVLTTAIGLSASQIISLCMLLLGMLLWSVSSGIHKNSQETALDES